VGDTKQSERAEYLSPRTVAAIADVSVFTVRRRIRAGELEAVRLGAGPRAPLRIPRRAVDEWLRRDDDDKKENP
jgi:excisionase family DNA binding protein